MEERPLGAGWFMLDGGEGVRPLYRRAGEPAKRLPLALADGMLRDIRIARELTQRDAADEIGVTESCYARWERGQRLPTPLSADALLRFLLIEEEATT